MRNLRNSSFLLLAVVMFASFGSVCAEPTDAAAARIKVACVGDSITDGAGLKDRATESYPGQLQQMLGDGFEVQNFGLGGRTLLERGDHPYTKSPKFEAALQFNPDVVIIKLGTNDSKSKNWNHRRSFIPDYLRLINRFRRLPSR